MDDVDLGVALSVTSLVMALAQDNMEQYKGAYVKAAARLKRILIDGEFSPTTSTTRCRARGSRLSS